MATRCCQAATRRPIDRVAAGPRLLQPIDRVASNMTAGQVMPLNEINQSFARLHRLLPAEVAQWTLYADVERTIREELSARFKFLTQKE